jgi:DNA replication protein DnaC
LQARRRPTRQLSACSGGHLKLSPGRLPTEQRWIEAKLADRARAEEWGYEKFAQALLSTEVSAREAHGGEGRIRSARFPARKTLEEFDFTSPSS